MAMFDDRRNDEIPVSWKNRGRHSTQGYSLTDLVGYKRVMKLAQHLHKKSGSMELFNKYNAYRILMRMDNRFRSHFLMRRFGETNMADAALVYVEVLERELSMHDVRDVDLRKVLAIGTVHEFKRWCVQWREKLPSSDYQIERLIHNLRVSLQRGISLAAKKESEEWLQNHPGSKMTVDKFTK